MTPTLDILNSWLPHWLELMWAITWQSAILAAMTAVLCSLSGNASPAVRYWLWQLIAVKLLLMPFWTIVVTVPLAFAAPTADQAEAGTTMPGSTTPSDAAALFDSGSGTRPSNRVPTERESASRSKQSLAPKPGLWSQLGWSARLLLAWCLVVCLQLLHVLRHYVRLCSHLRRATATADEKLLALLNEAAARMGLIRVPRLLLTDADCSPFVCGPARATLVLPTGLLARLHETQLLQVLLHELAHVKRYDLLLGWIPQIARMLYFFNPCVHWVCFRIRLERELACDQLAMALSDGDAADYAQTLLAVVGHVSEPTRFRTAASQSLDGAMSTAMHADSDLQLSRFWKRRLTMLPAANTRIRRLTRWGALLIGLFAIVAVLLPTMTLRMQRSAEVERQAFQAQRQFETASTLQAEEVKRAERSPKPAPVEFLPRPSKAEQAFLKSLEAPVSFDFQDVPLRDALQKIFTDARTQMYLDAASLSEEGISLDDPITLQLKEIRLEAGLNLLLSPRSADFVFDDDVVKILSKTKANEVLMTRTYPVRDVYVETSSSSEGGGAAGPPMPAAGGPTAGMPGSMSAMGAGHAGLGGLGGFIGTGGFVVKRTDLIQAIIDSAEPSGNWSDDGGAGSIIYVKDSGSLVIRQTWSNHRRILQLLAALREAKQQHR